MRLTKKQIKMFAKLHIGISGTYFDAFAFVNEWGDFQDDITKQNVDDLVAPVHAEANKIIGDNDTGMGNSYHILKYVKENY